MVPNYLGLKRIEGNRLVQRMWWLWVNRDILGLDGTTVIEFQDRRLRPLGHPSRITRLGCDYIIAHVRLEYVRNLNGAVSPLVVLQDCDDDAWQSQAGAVQCVHKLRSRPGFRSITQVGATGLEVLAGGAGADF